MSCLNITTYNSHDFHDNLYILLRGRKRFVLYPPSAYPYLHLRGKVERCWPNGLLVYKDEDHEGLEDLDNHAEDDEVDTDPDEAIPGPPSAIRSDGLHPLDAARWRVSFFKSKLELLPTSFKSGGTKGRKRVQAELDAAREQLRLLLLGDEVGLESGDGDEDDDSEDEDEEPGLGSGLADDDSNDEDGWSVGSAEEADALIADLDNLGVDATAGTSSSANAEKREPPSFSRIPARALHAHLGLSSTLSGDVASKLKKNNGKGKSLAKGDDLLPMDGCPPPLVVTLEPGEMIYLPAGWFHEVTSSSSPSTDETSGAHIAFN
jgi:hypothetical protein